MFSLEKFFKKYIKNTPSQYASNEKKSKLLKERITELTRNIEQQMIDYDALLNGIETMVWLTYEPEKQGKANEAFLKFFGVTQEEVEGKPLNELMSKEEAEKCISVNNQIFETGNTITTYEWVTRYDGQKRLLKINKRLKENSSTYIVASAEDITDLEKTRIQLEKESRFTNSLVDTAHALIVVLDTEGNILRCNKYFEEITGYTFSEIKGLNWFETFVPKSDHIAVKEVFHACLDTTPDCKKSMINPIKTKNGKEILVEWFSQTLVDNYNVAIGIISIGQDCTTQKIKEEELCAKIIDLEIKLKKAQGETQYFLLNGKGKTILIVEDDQNILQLISIVLQKQNYTVIQASSSKKAKEIIDSDIDSDLFIDLIVTDYYLKEMNGLKLVNYAEEKIPGIKYLIITGIIPTSVNIPDKNFLKKPFYLENFLSKIKTIMEN